MNETVNLMQFEGWTIFYHVIKVLITYNVSRALLKNKYNQVLTFVCFFAVVFGFAGFTIFLSSRISVEIFEIIEVIFFLFNIPLVYVFCHFFYEGKVSTKIVSSVISVFTYPTIAAIFKVIITMFLSDWTPHLYSYEVPAFFVVAYSSLGFFASFLIVLILKLTKTKHNSRFSYQTKYCWFYFFPISHWITNVAFQVLSKHITEDVFANRLQSTSSAVYVFFVIIDFALIFFIDHFENLEIKNVQNELIKAKNELDYSQIELLKEEKQNFRKIKHDYLNFLTVAQGLIEIKQNDKALELLKDTTNELMNVSNIPLCSNETINTALYIKQNQAKQVGVDVNVSITENYPLKLSDYDVSRILFNLLDNAIEAVNEIDKYNKNINLNIEINENELSIYCDNLCSGKKTYRSPERGNGIKIIKDIVKKYDGEFEFNISGDEVKKAETKIKLLLKV